MTTEKYFIRFGRLNCVLSSLHVDTLTLKVATFEGRAFQELNKIKFGDKGKVPN